MLAIFSTLHLQAQTTNYFHVEITVYDCLDSILPNAGVTLDQVSTPITTYLLEHYYTLTDSNGIAVFDSVLSGIYNLTVYKPEYDTFVENNIEITSDFSTAVHLMPIAFPPRFFKVDSLSSVATWRRPMREAILFQDFEDEQFPPTGWQTFGTFPHSHTWLRSNNGGSNGFPIPPGDDYYAVANSDMYGSDYTCSSYLITPAFDLTGSESELLEYRSYYTAAWGETATVEYSIDSGNTWTVLHYTPAANHWIYDTVDLSAFAGPNGEENLYIGFYANDYQISGSGWAIDNVWIHSGYANPLGYFVFLDNQIIDYINHDTNSYTYQGLNWGQTYTGGLEAVYPCRTSPMVQYTWTSAYLYPPRNFSCEYTYNADEIMAYWNPPAIVAVDSNSNLLSFNIYIDDSLYTNYPYQGEPVDDTLSCIMDSISPGFHKVKASALYELSNYGFPGQIGESMFSDTAFVYLTYGYTLPFFEGWDIPNFQFNRWKVSENGASCTIDRHFGDPPGSVSLEPITDSTEYFTTLTSYSFNASRIVDGEIFLDFRLNMETQNPDNSEHFKVEVFNGAQWTKYLDIIPQDSICFAKQHLNITQNAKHRVFKIRFTVLGNKCNTDTHWNIDNIYIYRECVPPANLTGDYFWTDTLGQENFGTKICWTAPEITPEYYSEWIYWGSNDNNGYVSNYNFGYNFSVAQRWDKEMFYNWNGLNLDGYYIKKLNFNIGNSDSIIAKIWTGNNASNLIWSDTFACNNYSWNEIAVNVPIQIDASKEYWIGYTVNSTNLYTNIGITAGTVINNYGNMILPENSNIWGNLTNNLGIEFLTEDFTQQGNVYTISKNNLPTNQGNRAFQGFNIYRMADNETDYSLYATIPYVCDSTSFCFYDYYPNVSINHGYFYKVTALWEDIDQCESKPAKALEIPADDFVYVFITDIKKQNENEWLKIYPNPASKYVEIQCKEAITSLALYNISGKPVNEYFPHNNRQITIDVSSIPAGIYLLKIAIGNKLITKKIVIK